MYHPLAHRGNHSLDSDHSNAPLAAAPAKPSKMSALPMSERDKHIPLNNLYPPTPDIEKGTPGGSYTRLGDNHSPVTPGQGGSHIHSPNTRNSSFFHEATNYDYRRGPDKFRVAQGDVPDTKVRDSFSHRLSVKLILA